MRTIDRATWTAQGATGLTLLALAACASPIKFAQQRPEIADKISCSDDRITRQGPVVDVCGYHFTAECEWKGLYGGSECQLLPTPSQLDDNRLRMAREVFAKDAKCELAASTAVIDWLGMSVVRDPFVAEVEGCGHRIRYNCTGGGGGYNSELPRCERLEYLEENSIGALSASILAFSAHTNCATQSIRPLSDSPRFEQSTDLTEVLLEGCGQTRAFTCPRFDPELSPAVCTDVTTTEKRTADEDHTTAAQFAAATNCAANLTTITTLTTRWTAYGPRATYKRASGCNAVMDFRCSERPLGTTDIQCAPLDLFQTNALRIEALHRFTAEADCRESNTRLTLRAVNNLDVHLTVEGCLHKLSDFICVYDPVTDTATCAPDKPMRALRSAASAAITENFSRAMSCPVREIKVSDEDTTPEFLYYEVRGCQHDADYKCPNHPGHPPACAVSTKK